MCMKSSLIPPALLCIVLSHTARAETPLPVCGESERTLFSCYTEAGETIRLCGSGDPASEDARLVISVTDANGQVTLREGDKVAPGSAYKANFLTTGIMTLSHLRYSVEGLELVLLAGEDQTTGLAGLGRRTADGSYTWQRCGEEWMSRLGHPLYAESRIPADPRAAPLP